MTLVVHLLARVDRGLTFAKCGRQGIGLTASTSLAAVTCPACRGDRGRPVPRPPRTGRPPQLVDGDV